MESMVVETWIMSFAMGVVVAAFMFALLSASGEAFAQHVHTSTTPRKQSQSVLLKICLPLIVALGQIIGLLPMRTRREKLRKKLIQAGQPGGLTPDEFDATRFLAFVFAVLAGMFFDSELGVSPVFAAGLGVLGILYPDIWLRDAVLRRRRRIFRDLPDLLDTLRLAVEAGLDLSSALKIVVEKGRRGPLLEELETADREITLGRTRREALKNFADRIAMSEINSFVLALVQADQLGASIGPILKAQSDMSRTRRWQLAEALVNKMPMKMLGPLVLFIFPSSFIVLFTPLIIQWMQAD